MGKLHGYRNAQVTVLAPTGTIAFMMDCDTTGIEPDIALISTSGSSVAACSRSSTRPFRLRRVPRLLARAASRHPPSTSRRTRRSKARRTREDHLPVFDCAFKPMGGTRFIHHMGHVRMMAAVQPFLSGAISKTVNMPSGATVEDIESAYMEAWTLGLKAVAIYRDGCKRSQPLSTGKGKKTDDAATKEAAPAAAQNGAPAQAHTLPVTEAILSTVRGEESDVRGPMRRRLPDERQSITHKFSIAGHEGYITVGMFEDGTPGEIFITMAKQGSVISGLIDCFATAISMALQYGVPLCALVDKFTNTRFEPSGITTNAEIRIAKSVADYLFRWLALKFLPDHDTVRGNQDVFLAPVEEERPERNSSASTAASEQSKVATATVGKDSTTQGGHEGPSGMEMSYVRVKTNGSSHSKRDTTWRPEADAPPCPDCGSLMVRNASCYRCFNCGTTNGCS
ncbi:MAG: hypothetical protein R3E97_18680 [Candidatus Eisenbacteria bacterium]